MMGYSPNSLVMIGQLLVGRLSIVAGHFTIFYSQGSCPSCFQIMLIGQGWTDSDGRMNRGLDGEEHV